MSEPTPYTEVRIAEARILAESIVRRNHELAIAQSEEDALFDLWKGKVQNCATTMSDAILMRFLEGPDCPDVTVEELAAALWIKEWLGEAKWDGSGRGSGGSAT